jgi:hypothetical protein
MQKKKKRVQAFFLTLSFIRFPPILPAKFCSFSSFCNVPLKSHLASFLHTDLPPFSTFLVISEIFFPLEKKDLISKTRIVEPLMILISIIST